MLFGFSENDVGLSWNLGMKKYVFCYSDVTVLYKDIDFGGQLPKYAYGFAALSRSPGHCLSTYWRVNKLLKALDEDKMRLAVAFRLSRAFALFRIFVVFQKLVFVM